MTASAHPVEGSWYNAYCSRVDLQVTDAGRVTGVYTSHTGSTGTSAVLGQLDPAASVAAEEGSPLSLGIQWRLVNEDQSKADGSWHWVSVVFTKQ